MHNSTQIVANEYGRAGDELAHLVLALAAEQAVERILGFAAADLAHLTTLTRYNSGKSAGLTPAAVSMLGLGLSVFKGLRQADQHSAHERGSHEVC